MLPEYEKEQNKKNASREWKTLNEANGCRYRKIGNDVEIRLYGGKQTYAGYIQKVMGVLPENCRPNANICVPAFAKASKGNPIMYFEVRSDGTVFVFNWSEETTPEVVNSFIRYIV